MAEGKNKVIWYTNWGKTFLKLSDEEAGKLIKQFSGYVLDMEPESPDRLTELLFDPIKDTLKRDLKSYEKKREQNRQNGSKGGRPRKSEENPKKPNGFSENPEKADKDKGNDTVSVTVNGSVTVKITSVYSDEVHDCFHNCKKYFPDHLHPNTSKKVEGWLDVIEKLNRIDKLPFETIEYIVSETRNDDFWAKNFLSIVKLRKKNGDGTPYVVVFSERLKSKTNGNPGFGTPERAAANREAVERLAAKHAKR